MLRWRLMEGWWEWAFLRRKYLRREKGEVKGQSMKSREKGCVGGGLFQVDTKSLRRGVGCLRNGDKSHVAIAKWKRGRFNCIQRIGI